MPVWLQDAMQIFPRPHFVSFAQSVLSRAAVWPELLIMAIIRAFYFAVSGVRFRRTLNKEEQSGVAKSAMPHARK